MMTALLCRPPDKGVASPQFLLRRAGGFRFWHKNPPALRATPLITGAKKR